MLAVAVSTRDAEAVMREFGLESLSSSQVSRAAKLLDGERCLAQPAAGRDPLSAMRKSDEGGVVRDAAALGDSAPTSAAGCGVSLRSRSDAFLETLVARGMRGVAYIVSSSRIGAARSRCHNTR